MYLLPKTLYYIKKKSHFNIESIILNLPQKDMYKITSWSLKTLIYHDCKNDIFPLFKHMSIIILPVIAYTQKGKLVKKNQKKTL